MKEKIYTIPVLDALNEATECPLCWLYSKLEREAIDFTMGPSYMENDIRDATNKSGFCQQHVQQLYKEKNRLGLALMLHTHQMKVQKDLKSILGKNPKISSKGLFKKKEGAASPLKEYIDRVSNDCYICNRIEYVIARYIDTFFYLWKKDPAFKDKVKASKGLCTQHFGTLYEESDKYLKSNDLEEFIGILSELYFTNIERVQGDLDWFITKFDYRFEKEPWKESKDALPRTIIKTNSYKLEQ
ncbi:hypothetical protein EDC18_103430 [Natranaerovirga pectinivora]|uniref:ABC transporter substrate-binding protein n=1 Tax=Natranaerovirga pectinivora TaxID=682400 RepID=A0A4R3MM06_9FIRM|nr:DUF6062 family protein [Natranaerovirga pectinivora]TCT15718.1 hypothetical protein EDC18_103430 [Natranaerovirga pectinivora]